MYEKNFKSLKKESEEDLRKWKELPCSWIGRINMEKPLFLPEAIYRFSAIPIKIPTQFFKVMERAILNFIWENKNPRIIKTVLNNTRTSQESLCLPQAVLLSNSDKNKTAWYWYKDRQVDQWNRIENPEIKPHTYRHLTFNKEAKNIQWKKESILIQ